MDDFYKLTKSPEALLDELMIEYGTKVLRSETATRSFGTGGELHGRRQTVTGAEETGR